MSNLDFGKNIRSGLAWDLLGSFFKQISGLVVAGILARLLSPSEFGIIAYALVFTSLSQIFIDVGFTDSLVQSESTNQKAYSSVFYVTIGLGLLLGILIFVSAPFLEHLLKKEGLTSILSWLSLLPIISSFGNVQNAIFVKKMDFKTLAYRNIIATILSGIVGVILALLDYGVYALVVQQILFAMVLTLVLWWKSDWRPSWVFSYLELKKLLSFSLYVFLDNTLNQIFKKIDTLFIGTFFSSAMLGFYGKAESLNAQIMRYTTSSLRKVIFPAFSKIQNNPKLFEISYHKVFSLAAFITVLACGGLFFLSETIIITVFGDQWQPSVIIFQILVFRLLISPFGGLMGKSLLAKGYSKQKFQIGQINRVILLSPILVGYYKGSIIAFAITLVVANVVGFLINVWAVDKYLKISLTTQLRKVIVPILPLLTMIVLYYYFQVDMSSFALFFIFITIQVLYSFLIRDVGFQIFIQQIKLLSKKNLV